ncbi:hypothetical protein GE061_020041 [Apolygus lucorum]|uniref:1-acylglycerol-3-phosphate O-acyltransferase n=1 Tax=Apolygus lucorum TaxID=248454 RepID=A0A8S9XA47_APOLU|nr:hypothetical protein GE061_020041 [Apolygus lucorum]
MSINVQEITFVSKVHFYVVMTVFTCGTTFFGLIFIPLIIIFSPIFPGIKKWYIRLASAFLCWLIGLDVQLEGLSELKSAPNGVIVMNHQSIWDFLLVCAVYHHLGDTIHTVSRKEVYYLWPLGYAMKTAGGLFIDRSSPRAAMNHLIEESRRIFRKSKQQVVDTDLIGRDMIASKSNNPYYTVKARQILSNSIKIAIMSNVNASPVLEMGGAMEPVSL